MSGIANIDIAGIAVPRLAFGLGSLMKWAPNHAYPLPTDSFQEVQQAIAAGFRHFNTGDLYTNNPSAASAIKSSGIPRDEFFLSLKLNTYAQLGCKGKQDLIDSVHCEIERFGLNGYVDLLQLHFPPRGYPGNLTNREAWRVLEELRDQGAARIIGVSNWAMQDYLDLMDSPDLKYVPSVNEYEFNPFLLFDPKLVKLRSYEHQHGVIPMNYGVLTILTGKLDHDSSSAMSRELKLQSEKSGLSPAELLLSWAYHRLNGVVVTSTSKLERARRMVSLLSVGSPTLSDDIFKGIEEAAEADGPEGKIFYKHGHMEKSS